MKFLFLDNDHVLNCGDKDRHPNRYLPLHWRHVSELNRILEWVPDLQIVISSAWRYHVLNGEMTLKGMEEMYMHFGANVFGRIQGVTGKDKYHLGDPEVEGWPPEDWHREGLIWRKDQIVDYLESFDYLTATSLRPYVVLDDLPLEVPNLVQTTRQYGLTPDLADEVIRRFNAS